jgi:hypothetical protein
VGGNATNLHAGVQALLLDINVFIFGSVSSL